MSNLLEAARHPAVIQALASEMSKLQAYVNQLPEPLQSKFKPLVDYCNNTLQNPHSAYPLVLTLPKTLMMLLLPVLLPTILQGKPRSAIRLIEQFSNTILSHRELIATYRNAPAPADTVEAIDSAAIIIKQWPVDPAISESLDVLLESTPQVSDDPKVSQQTVALMNLISAYNMLLAPTPAADQGAGAMPTAIPTGSAASTYDSAVKLTDQQLRQLAAIGIKLLAACPQVGPADEMLNVLLRTAKLNQQDFMVFRQSAILQTMHNNTLMPAMKIAYIRSIPSTCMELSLLKLKTVYQIASSAKLADKEITKHLRAILSDAKKALPVVELQKLNAALRSPENANIKDLIVQPSPYAQRYGRPMTKSLWANICGFFAGFNDIGAWLTVTAAGTARSTTPAVTNASPAVTPTPEKTNRSYWWDCAGIFTPAKTCMTATAFEPGTCIGGVEVLRGFSPK